MNCTQTWLKINSFLFVSVHNNSAAFFPSALMFCNYFGMLYFDFCVCVCVCLAHFILVTQLIQYSVDKWIAFTCNSKTERTITELTRCDYEVHGMILLRHLNGAIRLDRSKDMSVQYLAKRTSYEAPQYAVFSSHFLPLMSKYSLQ